jgi:hypothetical protein
MFMHPPLFRRIGTLGVRKAAGLWACLLALVTGPAWAANDAPGPCAANAAWASRVGAEVTHRYAIQGRAGGFPYRAGASMTWQPGSGSTYRLSYEIKAFWGANRRQNSEGLWSGQGQVQPLRFSEQAKRSVVTTVDVSRKRVLFPEGPGEGEWVSGSQDKLSVWAQLGMWVMCQPKAYEKSQAVTLPVWGSGETESWRIESLGWERVETPAGDKQALHLSRPAGMGGDSRIDAWFVPEWGVLPVRLLVEQPNGDRADQRLSERTAPP